MERTRGTRKYGWFTMGIHGCPVYESCPPEIAAEGNLKCLLVGKKFKLMLVNLKRLKPESGKSRMRWIYMKKKFAQLNITRQAATTGSALKVSGGAFVITTSLSKNR